MAGDATVYAGRACPDLKTNLPETVTTDETECDADSAAAVITEQPKQ